MAVNSPFNLPLPIQYGCRIWYNASRPNIDGSLPANGASMQHWYDSSGFQNDALQNAGGNRPTFVLNDGGTPSIAATTNQYFNIFNATGDPTNYRFGSSSNAGNRNTIFVVATPSAIGVPAYLVASNSGVDSEPAIISQFNPGSGVKAFEFINGADRQTFATSATGYHVLGVQQTDGVSNNGYYDGVLTFSFVPTVVFSGTSLAILFSSTGAIDFYQGSAKHLVVFDYSLTATQMVRMSQYLMMISGGGA